MDDKKYTILFIIPEGRWNQLYQCMFSDLLDDSRVIAVNSIFPEIHSKLGQLVRFVHFSRKVNSIIKLPFKGLWKYTLDDIDFQKDKKYILIFPNSVYPITVKYIKNLKSRFDVTCVLFLLNALSDLQIRYTQPYEPYLEYIFTFDYGDARKYGYTECDNLYSKTVITETNRILYDMYSIGNEKGRLKSIERIAELAQINDVLPLVRVMNVKTNKINNNDHNIIFNQWISYNESLKEMLACNCILELLSAGQSGATLRYYEAVCYNKKLLTNNKNVVNLPFYDPDYMKVFENPEDIDWNWVKERIPVDYHYDGRFSPVHLIDKIIKLEEAKNK